MNRIFRSFLLLTSGIWFLKLLYFEQLSFYILPRFNILVLISGCLFILLGIYALKKDKNHREKLSWQTVTPFIFLFALGFLVPARPLSSMAIEKRGIETDLSTLKLTAPVEFNIDSSQRTFADWIKIISNSTNVYQHAGERVKIRGFIHRTETLKDQEFYAARFLIRCCSADARPVILRAKYQNHAAFENDTWVEIHGTFQTDNDPQQPLFIDVDTMVPTETPTIPYIY